jgi:hypothetical protein
MMHVMMKELLWTMFEGEYGGGVWSQQCESKEMGRGGVG